MATETKTKTFYSMAHAADSVFKTPMTNSTVPIGVGVDNWDGAAGWELITGANAETYVFWPFDVSIIPLNATIDSVECKAVAFGTTYSLSNREIQLFSGVTAKGSPTNYDSATILTLTPGVWTRTELQNIRLRVYSKRGLTNTDQSANAYFGGADLTVTYTYQNEKFMLKLDGTWHDAVRIFKKVSGIWVEQTDLANVIENGTRYKNGEEIISPNKTVNIVGSGNSSNCYVTINGVKYTSDTKLSVPTGTVITVVAKGSSATYPGEVFVDGAEIPANQGTDVTYDYIVTSNSALCFSYFVDQSQYSGGILIWSKVNRNVIEFMISGGSIFCEEGMTWEAFVESRYNPGSFIISGNLVVITYNGDAVGYISGVTSATVIVEGETYTLSYT